MTDQESRRSGIVKWYSLEHDVGVISMGGVSVWVYRSSIRDPKRKLSPGEEVEFRLKSDDTTHGFRVVGGDVNIAIPKRGKGEAVVLLRLQEPGRYRFECSRMCGAGHNFMRGELIVREPDGRSTP